MRLPGMPVAALVGLLLLTLVSPVFAETSETCSGSPNPANPFVDVANDSVFCVEISWLASEGITTGRADGTFAPGDNLTRGQMAAFLYRYADEPAVPADAPTFPDVIAESTFAGAISWLASEGITTGRADGSFAPSDNLTRGQMAAFLYRYADEPVHDEILVTGFVGGDLQRSTDDATFSFSLVEDATEYDNVEATNVIAVITQSTATLLIAGQPASDAEFAEAVTDADVVEYRKPIGDQRASVDLVAERVRPMMFKIQRFEDGFVYGDGVAAPGSTFTLTIADDDAATVDVTLELTAGTESSPSRFGVIGIWELGNPATATGGIDASALSEPLMMVTETIDDYGPLRHRVEG